MKDTRAALVEHFQEKRFVHPAALFAPDDAKLAEWLARNMEEVGDDDEPGEEPVGITEDGAPAPSIEVDSEISRETKDTAEAETVEPALPEEQADADDDDLDTAYGIAAE